MGCDVCGCPLTRLKLTNGRRETRKKCARCAEVTAQEWKPPKKEVTKVVRMKAVKETPVYRAPQGPRTGTAVVLAIDAFMKTRGKFKNG